MKTQVLIFSAVLCLSASHTFSQWTDQSSGITNDLNDVFFLDNTNGWAVGRQGKILSTNNGGSTWSQQSSGTTDDLNKVHMVSSTVGFAVGNSGTVVKYNGSNWSAIDISYSQDMHGVYFIDESNGWISGDWGRIMMTTDGGASWTTQVDNSMYTNLFYDLHMVSAFEGWAVGTSGRVLKFNGSSWSNVSTPATTDLYSVHFSGPSNGFMSGVNSTMFRYDGSSWSTYGTSLPDNTFHVYDLHVVNNSLAYAATTPGFGGQGIILKFDGSSWLTDYEYAGIYSELFYGIGISPGGKAFAVGAGGMVKSNDELLSFGIDEEDGLSFYPNPADERLSIKWPGGKSDELTASIFNSSGSLVMPSVVVNQAGNETTLNISYLPAGVYFVQFCLATEIVKTEKLVVLQ